MNTERNGNYTEKWRLRERIDRHVAQFLASGGRIQVLDAPGEQGQVRRARSSAWRDLGDPVVELEDILE